MSRGSEIHSLSFWEVETAEGTPVGEPCHIAWEVGGGFVAVIPVRFARSPVLLLAVPSDVVDADTVPLSPSGRPASGDVQATPAKGGRRSSVAVSLLAMSDEAFGLEVFLTMADAEASGHRVRGFGPGGMSLPKPQDVLNLAYSLGFTADTEDAWVTADDRDGSDGEIGVELEEGPEADASFGSWENPDVMLAQGLRDQQQVAEAEPASEAEAWSLAESRQLPAGMEEEAAGALGAPAFSPRGVLRPPRRRQPLLAWGPDVVVQPGARAMGAGRGAGDLVRGLVGGPPPMAEVPPPTRGRGRGKQSSTSGFLPPSSKSGSPLLASVPGSGSLPGARVPKVPQVKKTGASPAAQSAKTQPVDWSAVGDDFSLQSLLAAGVDPTMAMQMAMIQSMERLHAPASVEKKKRKKPIFGLEDALGEAGEDEESGSSDDAGKLPALAGAKGAAASARLRESMRRHPERFSAEIRRRAAESLMEPTLATSSDGISRYIAEEVPVNGQKAMGFLLFGLGQVHRLVMEGKAKEAELLILRLIAASDQACLDGTWKTGWALTGLPEPAWAKWSQIDLATLRKTHGTSRLVSESWTAVETQRLRDTQYLVKQRPGNTDFGNKGKKDKEGGG